MIIVDFSNIKTPLHFWDKPNLILGYFYCIHSKILCPSMKSLKILLYLVTLVWLVRKLMLGPYSGLGSVFSSF